MKKSSIVFLIATVVLLSTGLWFLSSNTTINPMEYLHLGVIIMVVDFAVFVGIKRLRSEKRGEPAEDELSKNVMIRTAALSYYISLYFWVALLFLKDRIHFGTEELLGTGILGMAAIFALSWFYYNFRGLRDA
jgi:peptidoglycan/LPS O-acetylase OafA/YrhL